ncbi:peptidoglycan-binding protein [Streptomyces sp. NPDC059491]|uniref:peptidoglycan-binding domain-containing protein n=1 Tax=Streptomyces sp. NPDC059491 TaxID=3346850 RepID=UPI003689D3BA
MRNRTALTTAVTSSAPESESRPGRGELVFGKVARPGDDALGASVRDLELFEAPTAQPTTPGEARPRARHAADRARRARKAPRPRKVRSEPEREDGTGISLPLLVVGALAAGFGLTVGLTSGMDQGAPESLTLAMPDLPPPATTPDAEPPTVPTSPPTAHSTPVARAPRATEPATAPASAAPTHTAAPTAPPTPTPGPTKPAAGKPAPSRTPGARPSQRPEEGFLRLGSAGPEVKELQRRLQQLYLYLGSADGAFNTSVQAALSRFQAARHIPEEPGVYGPLTRAALLAETVRDDRTDRPGWDDWSHWSGWNDRSDDDR